MKSFHVIKHLLSHHWCSKMKELRSMFQFISNQFHQLCGWSMQLSSDEFLTFGLSKCSQLMISTPHLNVIIILFETHCIIITYEGPLYLISECFLYLSVYQIIFILQVKSYCMESDFYLKFTVSYITRKYPNTKNKSYFKFQACISA